MNGCMREVETDMDGCHEVTLYHCIQHYRQVAMQLPKGTDPVYLKELKE